MQTLISFQKDIIAFFVISGSPFAEDQLSRSSTLPLDQNDSTYSPSLTSSLSSSFKNLTKSNVTSRLSSLKKGSSYFANYLSPNPSTSKKTQEALSQGITSIRSAYNSAATVVSKRVGEFRESVQQPGESPVMSPASSYQYLALTSTSDRREEDSTSLTSGGESRRPSAAINVYDQDTWSNFTGALWEQLWATNATKTNTSQRLRAADITERYEILYSKLPKHLPVPEAMQVQMTSCSRCRYCAGILFDEEILSGWSADDSNLNTNCLFCDRQVVPFLTIRAVDFRTRPQKIEVDTEDSHPLEEPKPPHVLEHITVPYLSPLVLRKELENLLEREGDQSLLDPASVDDHPIIFWNLLWYFDRVAVKSHLPGLCLKAKSLNPPNVSHHPSWEYADHRNVKVLSRWDNERLHESQDAPLYSRWRRRNERASVHNTGELEGHFEISFDLQEPAYKGIMEHIITGVQHNDLLQVNKNLSGNRVTLAAE